MPRKLEEIKQDLEKYWSEQYHPEADDVSRISVSIFNTYGTHDLNKILDKIKRRIIKEALILNHGVVTVTAEYIGCSAKWLTSNIEKYNINLEKIRQDWHERKKEPKPYRKHITRKDRREG